MATGTLVPGTKTSLTTTAVNSLGSATYVSAGTINVSAINPVECLVEVNITPGTVSSNKRVMVFAKISVDNSVFSSGPESGTTTTDEPNLYYLGEVPANTNSGAQSRSFPLGNCIGFIPPYSKIIIKNESGAALAASGNSVYYTPYTLNIA